MTGQPDWKARAAEQQKQKRLRVARGAASAAVAASQVPPHRPRLGVAAARGWQAGSCPAGGPRA